MVTYSVELFGLSNDLAALRHVRVELSEGASLADLVRGLRSAAPVLDGRVIDSDEDRLANHYLFNVNGRFHVDEYDVTVTPDDHILVVTFALGG
jgi:hypothetical protein